MATAMTSGWRRGIAAALIVVLTLSGLGRAMASPSGRLGPSVASVEFPICHSGGAPAGPATPASHPCCDVCALMASALLSAPPRLGTPAFVPRLIHHAAVSDHAPDFARPRDPRLSRGPPSA